jgi:hypothetical protein
MYRESGIFPRILGIRLPCVGKPGNTNGMPLVSEREKGETVSTELLAERGSSSTRWPELRATSHDEWPWRATYNPSSHKNHDSLTGFIIHPPSQRQKKKQTNKRPRTTHFSPCLFPRCAPPILQQISAVRALATPSAGRCDWVSREHTNTKINIRSDYYHHSSPSQRQKTNDHEPLISRFVLLYKRAIKSSDPLDHDPTIGHIEHLNLFITRSIIFNKKTSNKPWLYLWLDRNLID